MTPSGDDVLVADDRLFVLADNPLIRHKISLMRDRDTDWKEFWRTVEDLAFYLLVEFMRDSNRHGWGLPPIPTHARPIITGNDRPSPDAPHLPDTPTFLFSLFRGGTPMANAFLAHLPNTASSHAIYGSALPTDPALRERALRSGGRWISEVKGVERGLAMTGHQVLVVDPIIGTGGSMVAMLEYLTEFHQVDPSFGQTTVFAISAHPDGVRAIHDRFPDVGIFLATMETGIDEKGFLVPGFGDVGDRCFSSRALGR